MTFFIEISAIVDIREVPKKNIVDIREKTADYDSKSATTVSCKLEQPRMDFLIHIRQAARPN